MHTEIGLRIWGTNTLGLQFYVNGNLDFLYVLMNCKCPFIFTQCSSYFSCCHDKMSNKKQVKEELWLTVMRVLSSMVGMCGGRNM